MQCQAMARRIFKAFSNSLSLSPAQNRGKYPAAKPVEAAFGESIPAIKLRMHNLQG